MDARKLTKLREDVTSFLDDVAGPLGHPRRRRWCDAYVRGILLDGHRKSVEPMAARLKAIERGDEDYEQALQHFLNPSPWDEQELLGGLHAWIGRRFGTDGFRIIDDTGFPKPGEYSVGVARPYTGTLGQVASCHVVALDARLYRPEAWTEDGDRLAKAGVPAPVGDQPKWQMALAMVRPAHANGLRGVVLADRLFGTVTAFREPLDRDGRADGVGLDSTRKVIAADADLGPVPPHSGLGRPPTRPAEVRAGATSPSVKAWSVDRSSDFRPVTWREGSKGKRTGRFAAGRVRPAHPRSAGRVPLAAGWLLVEWPTPSSRTSADAAPKKWRPTDAPAAAGGTATAPGVLVHARGPVCGQAVPGLLNARPPQLTE